MKLSYDKDGNPIAPNSPKMNMGGKVEMDEKGSAVLKKGVSPEEAKPGAENATKQAGEDKGGAPNPADKSTTDSEKVEKK